MTKEPNRSCVGCGEKKPQPALHRLGLISTGQSQTIEMGRTISGRGAWICRGSSAACFQLAQDRKSFGRAFKTKISSTAGDVLARQLD